ncbi:alpha/beta fold hydrolase [Rhodovulum sp. DZ06]|uniref:alpha/beta fold hydrolase n=1 Tax=Rhodovulum sp. DZ06 TaxID=3425126 RepID=UPI003D334648
MSAPASRPAPKLDWRAGAGRLVAAGKSLEWAGFGPAPSAELPAILLLHEGLGCLGLWRDFPRKLTEATGLPVFAWSRAGYGRSDPAKLPRPMDYMTREAVEVLPDVIDAVGAEQVILFGHSDGGTIAAEYAGRVDDPRLRGVVVMAPHFFAEPMGLQSIKDAAEAFATTDMKARMGKHHDDPEAAFRGWNDAWLNPDFHHWNVADAIDGIRVPVLAIQGEGDQYGTRAQVDEIAKRSPAPVEVLMLGDCKHAPQFEQPQAVLDAVAGFVARLARDKATSGAAQAEAP